jgi:cytochrome b561
VLLDLFQESLSRADLKSYFFLCIAAVGKPRARVCATFVSGWVQFTLIVVVKVHVGAAVWVGSLREKIRLERVLEDQDVL